MKRYLVMALAAFVLVIAAPSAFAIKVRVVDPPSTLSTAAITKTLVCDNGTITTGDDPCNISQIGEPYTVTFLPCGDITGISTTGYTFCLYLDNVTKSSLSSIDFSLTVPGPATDNTGDVTCTTSPNSLTVTNCPPNSLNSGDVLNLKVTSIPPLSNNVDFYLLTNFVSQPDPATVTVFVPEPGELGLFGLGLLAIGVGCGLQRRRQKPLTNEAA